MMSRAVLLLAIAACGGAEIEPGDAGVDPPGGVGAYRLPWRPGINMRLSQDCDDSCCSDHVGTDKFAYDWARGGDFAVVAARGGTVTHLKMNSTAGCGTSGCVDYANVLVIDHGDGTQSTYLHLAGETLDPAVRCGGTVARGQQLAQAGTTGWSTGVHLHYQVSAVHPGATTCECGVDGTGCATDTVPWNSFWVSAAAPTVTVTFDEWPSAPQCANRRIAMPESQNH